jgi:hypothetical protein
MATSITIRSMPATGPMTSRQPPSPAPNPGRKVGVLLCPVGRAVCFMAHTLRCRPAGLVDYAPSVGRESGR